MNTIYYVLAVVWKELQVIIKDRGSLALFFMLPLLLSTMVGAANVAIEGEGGNGDPSILLDVCLVNEDTGDFGQALAEAITDIDELDVETFETVAEAEERVAKGESTAAIVIPADFTQKIDAYEPTSIEVIVDPAEATSASIVTGIMNQVVDEFTIWGEIQYGIRTILDESGLLADASPGEQRAV